MSNCLIHKIEYLHTLAIKMQRPIAAHESRCTFLCLNVKFIYFITIDERGPQCYLMLRDNLTDDVHFCLVNAYSL